MNAATTDTRLDIAAVVARAGALLAIDGWSRERLRELQQERLRALLAHAVERSPFYRDRLGPDAVEAELGDLPTLSKPTLVEEHDRIVTDPSLRADDLRLFLAESGAGSSFSDGYRVFATSGSTGIPGLFVYAADEFAHWIAVGLARLARVGVTGDTRLVAIGAPADVHITRQLFAAFQAGRQDVPRLSATTPLGEMTAALDAYRPEAVIGYASVLALLAQEQLEGRLSIRPRIAMATSEVLTDETVGWVEEAWGSPPLNVYAATEAPGIAMASLERVGMHVCEESLVLEVVDDDNRPVPDGVPGTKVLLTNLVNRAQPLIRYELSDSLVMAEGADPSGRPFSRIQRVDGRSDDILHFAGRDGREVSVHPYRLRAPFSALLDVRQYQIVHEPDCALTIRIVPRATAARDLPQNVAAAVTGELESAGVAEPVVRVDCVSNIDREPGHAAKLKLVISAR
ncbi:MAG TPA: AMP-binding protein [Gaiellaceae bacterium]|nr:AMP-binding protein [Gaiellaceae bacterium]